VKEIDHHKNLPTIIHESLWYTNEEWVEMEQRNAKVYYFSLLVLSRGQLAGIYSPPFILSLSIPALSVHLWSRSSTKSNSRASMDMQDSLMGTMNTLARTPLTVKTRRSKPAKTPTRRHVLPKKAGRPRWKWTGAPRRPDCCFCEGTCRQSQGRFVTLGSLPGLHTTSDATGSQKRVILGCEFSDLRWGNLSVSLCSSSMFLLNEV